MRRKRRNYVTWIVSAVISVVLIAIMWLGADMSRNGRMLKFGYVAVNSDVISGLTGIAIDQGYMAEELNKVHAEFQPMPFAKGGPAVNQALAGGNIDMAQLGEVPAAVAKSRGAETTLIDVQPLDYSTHIVTRKGLGAQSVRELAGKTVAVQFGSSQHIVLLKLLQQNGLTETDLHLINMTEVDAATAVSTGSIDAAVTTAAKGFLLAQAGNADVLFDTKGHPELSRLTVFVVRSQFAREHPEILTAYYRALLRAREYIKNHPEDMRALYIKAGTDSSVIDTVYPQLTDYGTDVGAKDENLQRYSGIIQFLQQRQVIDTPVDISQWYNGEYYQNALKEMSSSS